MRNILLFCGMVSLVGCNAGSSSSASSAGKTEIKVRAPGVTVDVEKKNK